MWEADQAPAGSPGLFGGAGRDTETRRRIEALAGVWEARERRSRRTRRLVGVDGDTLGFDTLNLFELTRRMRAAGLGFCHDLYGGPLEAACVRLGMGVEDVFAALCDMLDDVTTDPATDALAGAMRLADGYAHLFTHPGRSRDYPRAAAPAYCLSRLHPSGAFFPIPRDRIGAWLGVRPETAGRLIRRLDADRVIRLRRGQDGDVLRNHTTGEAREARYAGPEAGV